MKRSGISFVEIIIYVAIIAIVSVAFVNFSVSVSDARNKAYAVSEVQSNARIAMDIIVERIRSSTAINTSTSVFGTDPGSISLQMSTSSINPTIIGLDHDDGVIQIIEGLSEAVPITADEVKVTKLQFNLLGNSSKNYVIQIELDVEFAAEALNFRYSQSLRSAVSVRR